MCVSSVCGDSCSLNSIIVSNWGLRSQCSVVEGILSCLLTGRTFSLQMFRSQRGKNVMGVRRYTSLGVPAATSGKSSLNTGHARAGFCSNGQ